MILNNLLWLLLSIFTEINKNLHHPTLSLIISKRAQRRTLVLEKKQCIIAQLVKFLLQIRKKAFLIRNPLVRLKKHKNFQIQCWLNEFQEKEIDLLRATRN